MTWLIRITAAVVLCSGMLAIQAQPQDSVDQRKLRENITAADLTALSRTLMQIELLKSSSPDLRQLVREMQLDPQKLPPILKKNTDDPKKILSLIEQVPPGLMSKAQEKEVQDLKAELQQISSMPKQPHSMIEPPPLSGINPSPRSSRTLATLDPRLQNNPAVRNMLRLWERNFGSLEKTPALKQAFADLLNSSLQNEGSGGSPFESEELNSLFNPDTPFGREMAEWLDAAANGKSWKWSDLGLGNMSLKLPEAPLPSPGLNFSPPTLSNSSDSPSLMVVLLIAGAVGVGIAILRKSGVIWPKIKPASVSGAIETVDPASVVDRASLVRAFESLTLRILGREAEAWNHRAIATEFARRNLDAQEAVRLYEMARYSPPEESIPVEMYGKARHCLSVLDGVSPQ